MPSIRRHLIVLIAVGQALLLAAGGTGVYWAVRDEVEGQFDASLRTRALAVITNSERDDGELEVDFSDRFLREFEGRRASSYFEVWDEDGRSVERSDSLGGRQLERRAGTFERPVFWNLALPDGRAGRAIGFRFRPERRSTAREEGTIVVATDRRELDRFLARLVLILVAVGLAMLALAVLAIPRVLGRGLRPLGELAHWTRGLQARSLQERLSLERLPPELCPIGEALNELLARLDEAFERERSFSANFAHEVLTPLAEIRAVSEASRKWPDTGGPEAHARVLAAVGRMEALAMRLLELTRAENGPRLAVSEPVQLAPLLRELWAAQAPTADARGVQAEIAASPGVCVRTDSVLFRSILGNLLANAARYAPVAGRVRIVAAEKGPEAVITISNAAPDLDAADLPRLFERLWRKDNARTDGRSVGLGLPLAREFARLLGWRLDAGLSGGALVLTLAGPRGVG